MFKEYLPNDNDGRFNLSWVLAANIAALDTWTRLLGLHDAELARRTADPALLPVAPARPARHPRPPQDLADQRHLALEERVPHLPATPLRAPSTRLTSTKTPHRARKE
ncbi:hypothetical protein AB0J35_18630 [Nonomuraea angiospora]|uniref:hypothetical protein n=1 Tax=Nonomuraea angiospora TaxID=46172 RepID=UPI00343F7CB4